VLCGQLHNTLFYFHVLILKKKHPFKGVLFIGWVSLVGLAFYPNSLKAFVALLDIKSDLVSFAQRAEATAINGCEVNKNVAMLLRLNKPKPLFVIEPLYSTFRHV
jgi:hypothetical protein